MMKRLHGHMVDLEHERLELVGHLHQRRRARRQHAQGRENPALIQPDATLGEPYMFKRGYAFGNWSKFVRPGFQRIAATDKPAGGV